MKAFAQKEFNRYLLGYKYLLKCWLLITSFICIIDNILIPQHSSFLLVLRGTQAAAVVIVLIFADKIAKKNISFLGLSVFITGSIANSLICFIVGKELGLMYFGAIWLNIILITFVVTPPLKIFLLSSSFISAFYLGLLAFKPSYSSRQMLFDATILLCITLVSVLINKIARKCKDQQCEIERQNHYLLKVFAHDIKNKLQSSMLALYCLKESYNEDEIVNQAIDDQRKMNRIIANLLNVFSGEEIALNKEVVNTFELIERFKKDWALKLKKKDVFFKIECNAYTKVEIDRRYMGLVWDNLFSNAYQHTPDGGMLRVRSYNGGKYLYLVFCNSGPVIAKQFQKDMFAKYYHPKVHTPYNKGLGLHYSKMMCERHGGSLEYNISQDGLNEFIVKLPIVETSKKIKDFC